MYSLVFLVFYTSVGRHTRLSADVFRMLYEAILGCIKAPKTMLVKPVSGPNRSGWHRGQRARPRSSSRKAYLR